MCSVGGGTGEKLNSGSGIHMDALLASFRGGSGQSGQKGKDEGEGQFLSPEFFPLLLS